MFNNLKIGAKLGLGFGLVLALTVAVALLSATAREGALTGLASGAAARVLPALELTAGALILAAAATLLAPFV